MISWKDVLFPIRNVFPQFWFRLDWFVRKYLWHRWFPKALARRNLALRDWNWLPGTRYISFTFCFGASFPDRFLKNLDGEGSWRIACIEKTNCFRHPCLLDLFGESGTCLYTFIRHRSSINGLRSIRYWDYCLLLAACQQRLFIWLYMWLPKERFFPFSFCTCLKTSFWPARWSIRFQILTAQSLFLLK